MERPRYPGLRRVTDGSGAVAWVETHVTQGACAYPITPSSNMGALYAEAVADGARNLWDEPVVFLEPESEHSSASAAEGFAIAGGRVTNFTCGQGLILMKEVLYAISGKRLPAVFHIGARALTSQALNIHAGHDDVMGVADCGWGMLFAKNAQEAADLALVARRAAESCHTPFFNVQDGFLTTHTLEVVRLPEPELMKGFLGPPGVRSPNLFDPRRPLQSGVVQNQDAYMKGKVAQRFFTDQATAAIDDAMAALRKSTGRSYARVERYRMDDARFAIVALGSLAETAMATVDWVREQTGLACGVVHVTCFRPFPARELVEALSDTKAFAVIERLDDPLAAGNPLATGIKAAFADALTGDPALPRIHRVPVIHSGSAGLGSRDVRPADFLAALTNLAEDGRRTFVLGVRHPLALERPANPDLRPKGAFSLRGHSVGGFGSIATNRALATILGDFLGFEVQAYPLYGSEKKGLPTTYFLTAADERIRTHCELDHVELVPLASAAAFSLGNPLAGIGRGGTVFLQSTKTDPEQVWRELPLAAKRIVREKRLHVLYLDAARVAAEVSSRPELQVRMQGIVLLGVCLRAIPALRESGLAEEQLFGKVGAALEQYFGEHGADVVAQNLACVRRGYEDVEEIPRQIVLRDLPQDALSLAGKTVGDVMHRGVLTCYPETPLSEVVAEMRDRDVSAIVVIDEEGELEGILSSTDLRNAHLSRSELERELPSILPTHLMTREVHTTWPEEPLEHAARRLFDHHLHRLVVTRSPGDPTPVGVLSMSDLVALAEPAEEAVA